LGLFQYEFMRLAFWAVLLITPLFGIMGTMVVDNKLAFFSDALGHSALTGIALGVLLGVQDTTVSMVLFALLFAYLLNRIMRSGLASNDTLISVFSSTAMALGLALLSRSGQFARFSSYLIGDILTIHREDLTLLIIVFGGIFLFWAFFYNQLLAISVNRTMAATKGVHVRLIETLFLLAVAVVVTVSIKWVGILLINSLLILPAAAARNVAKNVRQYHFLSVLFSLSAGLIGLFASYPLGISTGPAIVLTCAVLFFSTYLLGRLRS
jgi:zinc transport system permease protein